MGVKGVCMNEERKEVAIQNINTTNKLLSFLTKAKFLLFSVFLFNINIIIIILYFLLFYFRKC
jgi:hypothetical protein